MSVLQVIHAAQVPAGVPDPYPADPTHPSAWYTCRACSQPAISPIPCPWHRARERDPPAPGATCAARSTSQGACVQAILELLWWRRRKGTVTRAHRLLCSSLPQIAFCVPRSFRELTPRSRRPAVPSHHGEISSRQWCVRPGRPPAPTRAPGGGVARPFLRGDRLHHCIGRRRSSATPSSALRRTDTLSCATIPDGTHALPSRRR